MFKVRITRGQALEVNAVGAVVAHTNPNLPIELPDRDGWILYAFDQGRRKWAYYLVTKTKEAAESHLNKVAGRAT